MKPVALPLVLVLGSCQAAAPGPSAADPPSPSDEGPSREREPSETATSETAIGEPGLRSSATQPELRAVVSSAQATRCERGCAEVGDCVVATNMHPPAGAALIELRCLEACVTAERDAETTAASSTELFGCARPAKAGALEAETCEPYLSCVRDAWPSAASAASASVEGWSGDDGCEQACEVFGRCWDNWTLPEQIASCVRKCEQTLDAEEERMVGACTLRPSCDEITACITELDENR